MVKTDIYEYSIPAHSYHIIIMHTKQYLSAQKYCRPEITGIGR